MTTHQIQQLNGPIFYTRVSLVDDYLPLYLPLVKGQRYAAFIDSGTKAMFPLLTQTMATAGVADDDLRFVIQTHSHADHIGNNVALKERTGCLIAGHRQYAHWHTDVERHYQEWARPVPELIPDTPQLRASVFDWFDTPHEIDVFIDEGNTFDLGGNVTLTAYRFPGHMRNDLGWLESSTRTLILGDAITATEWPHFHIHVTVPGYRATLQRLRTFLPEHDVKAVFMTHFGPVSASETQAMVTKSLRFLEELDRTVLRVVASKKAVTLAEVWTSVAASVNKTADHQSLTSIYAHVEDFLARGLIREVAPRTYAL